MLAAIIGAGVVLFLAIFGAAWRLSSILTRMDEKQDHLHDCIEAVKEVQKVDHRKIFTMIDNMRAEITRHLTRQDRENGRDRSPAH